MPKYSLKALFLLILLISLAIFGYQSFLAYQYEYHLSPLKAFLGSDNNTSVTRDKDGVFRIALGVDENTHVRMSAIYGFENRNGHSEGRGIEVVFRVSHHPDFGLNFCGECLSITGQGFIKPEGWSIRVFWSAESIPPDSSVIYLVIMLYKDGKVVETKSEKILATVSD